MSFLLCSLLPILLPSLLPILLPTLLPFLLPLILPLFFPFFLPFLLSFLLPSLSSSLSPSFPTSFPSSHPSAYSSFHSFFPSFFTFFFSFCSLPVFPYFSLSLPFLPSSLTSYYTISFRLPLVLPLLSSILLVSPHSPSLFFHLHHFVFAAAFKPSSTPFFLLLFLLVFLSSLSTSTSTFPSTYHKAVAQIKKPVARIISCHNTLHTLRCLSAIDAFPPTPLSSSFPTRLEFDLHHE